MANSKMFVYYSKTKAEFISAGLPATYTNHIVFIKGDANGNGSCIYTHGMYFANFAEFLNAINYVKGIKVGTDTYNASAGGGYVAFEAVDPSTLSLDVQNGKLQFGLTTAFVNKVNNTANNLGRATDAASSTGSAFARIANLAAIVSQLTGSEGGELESVEGQITKAINTLRTEITGDLSDTTDAKTIQSINDELNGLDAKVKAIEDAGYITIAAVNSAIDALGGSATSTNGTNVNVTVTTENGEVKSVSVDETGLTSSLGSKADLANGKILASQLPDYILGQVMFGGTIASTSGDSNIAITPSTNFTAKYGNIDTIPVADAAKYEGVYFIAQVDSMIAPAGQSPISYNIGDWIISTGSTWVKVDNTDAVTMVAGLNGVITPEALAAELAKSNVTGALATKAEVTNVKVSASGDTLIEASVDTATGRVITVGATNALETAVNNANSAYQKPSTGIAKTDLASDVQTSLGKADAAAPQSTTYNKTEVDNKVKAVDDKLAGYYTKTEVDAMWEWEEL